MAIAVVANTGKAGSTNGVTTNAIATTGANLIVTSNSWFTGPSMTFSDSLGNSYASILKTQTSSQYTNSLRYCVNPTVGASHTFSCTGNFSYASMCVLAVSGANATPADQTNGASSASATTLATGSVTPSENNEIIVTGLVMALVANSHTINGGFTISDDIPWGASNMACALGYLIQTTATAANPSWSWTSAMQVAVTIGTLKAASAGGKLINNMHDGPLIHGRLAA